MHITHTNYKTGLVKLRITDLDDLWYLSHLIDPGDFVKGFTTRKIKIGDGDNAKVVRKPVTLKIEVETVDLGSEGISLKINGRIREGPEDIPKDSYHSINLEEGSDFVLEKVNWLEYQKQKLQESAEKKYNYLLCLFDREEVLFALTKKFGYEILVKMKGQVAKKSKEVSITKDFHQELIKNLETYNERFNPEKIILASPAFYKDILIKKINQPELKRKIVLTITSDVSESAIDEVLKRPELAEVLKSSRTREEQLLVDHLLSEINKDNLAAYGLVEVQKAVDAGAVSSLLVTDTFITKQKEKNDYTKIDEMMKQIDSLQGKIHIISSKHEGGKKLDGLGGIAVILRYILNTKWKS